MRCALPLIVRAGRHPAAALHQARAQTPARPLFDSERNRLLNWPDQLRADLGKGCESGADDDSASGRKRRKKVVAGKGLGVNSPRTCGICATHAKFNPRARLFLGRCLECAAIMSDCPR
jgi:hypothetical protein